MNPEEYDRLYYYEDHYWWFVARRELALSLVREYVPKGGRILDVGCGAGAAARDLVSHGKVFPCDVSEVALGYCRKRGLQDLVMGDLQRLPFGSGTFQGVIALEVLEHIADDARAVCEISRVLAHSGILILTTPAYPLLWSGHDVALHHRRRYRKRQLVDIVQASGLHLVRCTHAVTLLFPVIAMTRVLGRWFGEKGRAHLWWFGRWPNQLLLSVMRVENRLLATRNMPVGVSLVVVARK